MGLTHLDKIVDSDLACVIDPISRKIKPNDSKSTIMQYDHNSERISFTINRFVEGHDMSKVDRIAVKYLNVKTADMYVVNDIYVSEETVTFTWLISGNATQEAGSLVFLINFRCYDDDGTITFNWSTQPCSTYSIVKGVESMDSNPIELYDFWARYKGLVTETSENGKVLEDKLEELIGVNNSLTESVEKLKVSVPVMESRVDTLNSAVPSIEDRVDILDRTVPTIAEKLAAFERTVSDDQLYSVNEELSDVKDTLINQGVVNYDLVYGTYVCGAFSPQDDVKLRVSITEMLDCSNIIYIVNGMIDYNFGVIYYDEDGTWSSADTGWIKDKRYTLRSNGYARINFSKRDDTALTEYDITKIKQSFKIYRSYLAFAKSRDLEIFRNLVNSVAEHYDFNDFSLALGTLSNGVVTPGAPARCCTMKHIKVSSGMYVSFNTTNYYFGVCCFNEDKVYDGVDHGWMQSDFHIDFDGYVLMNFRRSDGEYIEEADMEAIESLCCIKNYTRYSDSLKTEIAESAAEVLQKDRAISSISVEYGRRSGASYVFVRVPKIMNDGRTLVPKVRLTSDDGSISGTKCSTLTYSIKNGTVFTLNAGLFNVSTLEPVGQTIIDGISLVNTPMQDDNGSPISSTECYPLCIDSDGNLSAPYGRGVDTQTMLNDGVVQAITGWGKIVENYKITLDDINAEIVHQGLYIRQSIGQYQNGDYAICTVDQSRGNVENEAGITYEDLAQIFVDHGVKFAYSLDGGGSAETVIGNRQLNPIYEGTAGRSVPTVITFEIAD